ncbi:unnamed protein product [Meganyctiphanes norvegica]|uniref:VWFA domain-containing protein n=1 Tax=Meganyctiphanes norvegica TaxID=48144 RepID=A0AAV2QCD5_MEGNR
MEDFSSGGTDLTGALRTVREEVTAANQNYIRVFLVTDGAHGSGAPYPESEIQKMSAHTGKTIDVYLLGISNGFPVNISIDLRSRLHNGSANVPSLFWGKNYQEIGEQLDGIGRELGVGHISLTVTPEGHTLPGLPATSSIHLGEWMYFPRSATEIMPITITVEGQEPVILQNLTPRPVTMRHLLDHVYRQWNSILIQRHRNKENVPLEVFDMMESFFRYIYNSVTQGTTDQVSSITARLNKKNVKTYDIQFKTLLNQSKTVIGIEGKFKNELELAETILKTTVTNRKYDTRNLKMKGHGQSEYEDDIRAFKRTYEANKANIIALPDPDPEDCCRVTMTSTLKDLQDDDLYQLLDEDKFSFLKQFSISGIPILAPVKDAAQINPWVFSIKNILVTPFTILSTQTLEFSADHNADGLGDVNKDILLQADNENTRFNAVIPIVTPQTAETLKGVIRTNLFAMCTTFSILKNPHIVDHNAHMAALGVAWLRTIRDYKLQDRPEFVVKRLEFIDATANLYMDRKAYARYSKVLIDNPRQALMTESSDEFDGAKIKCESFVKPMFFYHLMKDKMVATKQKPALSLMILEFIGRCLSNYKMDDPEANRFTDFFSEVLGDPERRKQWIDQHGQGILSSFQKTCGNLLNLYFTLDDLNVGVKQHVLREVEAIAASIDKDMEVAVNFEKIKRIKNTGSCGDVTWASLHAFAVEMGYSEEERKEEFSNKKVLIYVCQALKINNSKERLKQVLPSYEDALSTVTKAVVDENTKTLKTSLQKQVMKMASEMWREQYMKIHAPTLVMPMTQQEIIAAATACGIQVDDNTFKQVYKRYNAGHGLLGNACQIPSCPHYLKPQRNFNQHLSVEREVEGHFPHQLHLVSNTMAKKGVDSVVQAVTSGDHSGNNGRRKKTPPQPDVLEPLKEQIKTLTAKYQQN